MRQILFVLALGLVAMAQAPTQTQLTKIPPKPTCNPNNLWTGADCQDRINLYNQAVQQRTSEELQMYVSRQKDSATAPLQEQIAKLNKLSEDQQTQIKKLQEQIQADAATALQSKSDAHKQGIEQGAGISAGAMVALFGFVFVVRKITLRSAPMTRGAAAR
jgi:hypothetical protein